MNKKAKKLIPERLEQVRAMLAGGQAVRVEDICRKLNISPPTARRDLERLERSGLLRRVHGGAVLAEKRLDEPLFDDKTAIAQREKMRIAAAGAKFVNPNDTIYIDGGSTLLEMARLLKDRSNVNIVTNSLRTALELSGSGPSVILIGGQLRRRSQTMVGSLTKFVLSELHFDKAFMGTIGLTLKDGMTTTDPDEAYTKQLAMAQSSEVILLADSGKIGKVSFAHAGQLALIDRLISDKQADAAIIKTFRKCGLEILLV
jgi:DeoR family transcriptional regulator, fructose operon transcriptional repressor